MALLVVQHTPDVGVGRLADLLASRDIAYETRDAASLAGLDVAAVDAAILLGGDAGEDPVDEADLIRTLLDQDVPMFGICHGAELIAQAVGGEVVARAQPEFGFIPLHRTVPGRDDDITGGWPDGAVGFSMHHGEVARLPRETDVLLVGTDGPSMWRYGSAYATSLHLEAGADTILAWLSTEEADAVAEEADINLDQLRDETERRRGFLDSAGPSLLLRWLDSLELTQD